MMSKQLVPTVLAVSLALIPGLALASPPKKVQTNCVPQTNAGHQTNSTNICKHQIHATQPGHPTTAMHPSSSSTKK